VILFGGMTTKRTLALGLVSVGLMVCSASQIALAQQRAATARPWTPPKTSWGEPDLQGIWPLNHLISTPLQRQEKFGNRREMTEDELAAAQKSAEARNTRFESGAIPQAGLGQPGHAHHVTD
jgi:hypothetical protein